MKKILIIIIGLLVVGCTKEEIQPPDYTKEISTLLEKNYTYSMLAYGNLEFEDSIVTVNEEEYNLIKDYDGISLKEMNDLIDEIFVPEKKEIFYNTLYEKRVFLEVDNRICVKNLDDNFVILDTNFTDFNIIKQTEEYIIINIDLNAYYIFY